MKIVLEVEVKKVHDEERGYRVETVAARLRDHLEDDNYVFYLDDTEYHVKGVTIRH